MSADYAALPAPRTPATFYVEVNEARIFATGQAATWWSRYRAFGPEWRFEVVTASLGGDQVRVTCDDREHADWLAGHMVNCGIPASAVKAGGRRHPAPVDLDVLTAMDTATPGSAIATDEAS